MENLYILKMSLKTNNKRIDINSIITVKSLKAQKSTLLLQT